VELKLLPIEEARRLEPALSPNLTAVGFCAEHAYVNPYKLTLAYAKAARRFGASFVPNTNVTGFDVAGGQVKAVVTDRGRIGAKSVILATGVDMAPLGKMVGLTIPVVPSRGQVLTTERTKPILNRPVESLLQTSDGSLLLGVTTEFVGHNNRVTFDGIQTVARRAVMAIPALRSLNIVRIWAGLRPWPIDGLPILGFVPHLKGVLLATGHSGITLAEITGRILTELVLTGKSSIPIEEYSLERFTSARYQFSMECYSRGFTNGS
jgi:sarcosine oxidase subunit beta